MGPLFFSMSLIKGLSILFIFSKNQLLDSLILRIVLLVSMLFNSAALNNALDEMDLPDVYRAFHPKEAKYTFFSNVHGTFSRIDHMIGHKTSLNKFKKIEIISSIFCNH